MGLGQLLAALLEAAGNLVPLVYQRDGLQGHEQSIGRYRKDVLQVQPVGQLAIPDGLHVKRLARQVHQCNVSRAVLRLDVRFDPLGLDFHHAHKLVSRSFNFCLYVAFE